MSKIKQFVNDHKEGIATGLAMGAAVAGAAFGYNEFTNPVYTMAESAAKATNEMAPYALGTSALLGARAYCQGRIGNFTQMLGRGITILSPAAMAYFMSDATYNPAVDLGPVLGTAIGEGLNQIGINREEISLGRSYMDAVPRHRYADDPEILGRRKVLDLIQDNASEKDLQRYAGELLRRIPRDKA